MKKVFALTNPGPCLDVNEDTYLINENLNLYGVMDGLGGHGIGDKIVRDFKIILELRYGKFTDDPDMTLPFYYQNQYSPEVNALMNVLLYSHQQQQMHNAKVSLHEKGGATFALALRQGDTLSLFLSGTCQALVFNNGKLISKSSGPMLMNGANKKTMCLPLSGIGLPGDLDVFISEHSMKSGDDIFLLTDGIWPYIEMSDYLHTLKNPDHFHSLLEKANKNGNWDNQTIQLLKF